jgi:hypothetical protein
LLLWVGERMCPKVEMGGIWKWLHTFERIILPEGMAFSPFIHHDPSQIGMAFKRDSIKIPNFPFKPVRPRPKSSEGFGLFPIFYI